MKQLFCVDNKLHQHEKRKGFAYFEETTSAALETPTAFCSLLSEDLGSAANGRSMDASSASLKDRISSGTMSSSLLLCTCGFIYLVDSQADWQLVTSSELFNALIEQRSSTVGGFCVLRACPL